MLDGVVVRVELLDCLVLLLYGISLLIVSESLIRNFNARFANVRLGVTLGLAYFILIPTAVLLVVRDVPLPMDFSETQLPSSLRYSEYRLELLKLLVCVVAILAVCLPIRKARPPGAQERGGRQVVNGDLYLRLFWASLAVYLSSVLLVFFGSGLHEGGHWYRSRIDFMEQVGGPAVLIVHLAMASRLLLLGCIVGLWLIGKLSLLFGLVCLLCLVVLDLYFTGNRIFALQSGVVILTFLVFKKRWLLILLFAMLAVPFGIAMQLFRVFRAFMHESVSVVALKNAAMQSVDLVEAVDPMTFLHAVTEAVNLHVLLEALKVYGDSESWLYGGTIWKLAFILVSREIWSDKPESVTVVLRNAFASGQETSLAGTIVGEMYVNFGLFFLVAAPLSILVLAFVVRKMRMPNAIEQTVGLAIGLIIVRMSYSDTLLSLLITYLLFVVLTLVTGLKVRINRGGNAKCRLRSGGAMRSGPLYQEKE